MPWYKITLTDQQVREGVVLRIQNQFTQEFMKAKGRPEEAAMFNGLKGNIIYFSPSTTKFFMDVINQYLGEETERPARTKVALLVGHDKVWNILFE